MDLTSDECVGLGPYGLAISDGCVGLGPYGLDISDGCMETRVVWT